MFHSDLPEFSALREMGLEAFPQLISVNGRHRAAVIRAIPKCRPNLKDFNCGVPHGFRVAVSQAGGNDVTKGLIGSGA